MKKDTRFKKGIVPWNKGKKGVYSTEVRKKMGWAKGKKLSPEAIQKRKGRIPHNKGISPSKETRLKISIANKGRRAPHREGSKSNLWKGGFSPVISLLRHCFKYRQWRSDIFLRDDFTCQECNKRGVKINAHHIEAFSQLVRKNDIKNYSEGLFCEELWNINNGLTLCEVCHSKTDNFAGRLNK